MGRVRTVAAVAVLLAVASLPTAAVPAVAAPAATTTSCAAPGDNLDRLVTAGRFAPTYTVWTLAGTDVRLDTQSPVGLADYVRSRGTLVAACQVSSVRPAPPR